MKLSEIKALIGTVVSEEVGKALKDLHDPERVAAANARREANGSGRVAVTAVAAAAVLLCFGGLVASISKGKGNLNNAVAHAKEHFADMPDVEKQLTAGNATEGGFLLSPTFSDQVIDLLTPMTVVRKRVHLVIDISSGTVYTPRLSSDVLITWGGEISKARASQVALDQISMRPFEPKVLVPFSNTLLARGGPRVASLVSNAVLRRMGIAEDQAFLTSKGTEHRPVGLRYQAPTANVFAANGTVNVKNTYADLGAAILKLQNADVPMTAPAWVFSPTHVNYLLTLLNTNGIPVFRDEMVSKGTVLGIPFDATTSIAYSASAGGDVMLYDADEIAIGQGQGVQIAMSQDGTFVDGDGNTISAFQQNLSLMRVINQVDIKAQHTEAIAVVTGAKWTPGAAA